MIGIGISTYNDYANVNQLLTSLIGYTDAVHGEDYSIIVVDDGTKNEDIFINLQKVCNKYGVRLVRNQPNRGIPYTWNRITDHCGTDTIIILNNDITIAHKNWLKYFEYFLNNNQKIGTIGFPIIQAGQSYNEKAWGDKPGRVGAAVGCCFGFKKDIWKQIKNPDGSIGFWEDLISFHEEIHFGFKLSELGYYNYMLNWPPMIHIGGLTFRENQELIERPIDWSKWNKEEYVSIIKKSDVYPDVWKRNRIVWTNEKGIEVVDRMAFSRYMFAKYWNVLDSYDAPQIPVHRKVIDPMPPRKVKWLDKNSNERETDG